MNNLTNKTVLITGASSGFGKACALKLADSGAKLILTARRTQRLEALQQQLADLNCKSYCMPVDVRESEAVDKAFRQLPEQWSSIDVLINNAGLALGFESLAEGNLSQWETMIDTNIKGLLYFIHQVLPTMLERNTGHIINIGSIAGRETYAGGVVYCASKAAVHAISQGLKKDVFGSNIRVSLISPGMAETEFSQVRFCGDLERAKKTYQGVLPLTANDVADSIIFCLNQPAHVNIGEIFLHPTAQSAATMVYRKS